MVFFLPNREQLSQQLIDACNVEANPDIHHISQLIHDGADVNTCLGDTWNPLMVACERGHLSVVNVLLQQPGIDINQAYQDGITPLFIACRQGHELVVQSLLQQPGIAINQAKNNGATPLIVASQKGHELVVQRLLQHPRIDMRQAMDEDITPLYFACQNGHELVVQCLLQKDGIDINQSKKNGITPLYIACQNGHESVVPRLLQRPDIDMNKAKNNGITPLYIACRQGHTLIVERLLQQPGIDINLGKNNGVTPLIVACEKGPELIVQHLLQHPDIEINRAANDGATALYIACQNGQQSIVQSLLQQPGIYINLAKKNGMTPLFMACRQGHELVVKHLLQHSGIDINQAKNNGATPLIVSCQKGHELIVQILLQQPYINVNKVMTEGATALYIACQNGNEAVVQHLLQQPGIDINQAIDKGITPLFVACHQGHESIARLLLNAKAELHHVDPNGDTALSTARKRGLESTVNLLEWHAAQLRKEAEQEAHVQKQRLELQRREEELERRQQEILEQRYREKEDMAKKKKIEAAEQARLRHEEEEKEKRWLEGRRNWEQQELEQRHREEEEATHRRNEAAKEVEHQVEIARKEDLLTGRSVLLHAIDNTNHIQDVKEIPLSYLEYISGEWESMLGSGGFGSVYKGFDDIGNVEVAIKVLRSDRMSNTDRALFQDEIKNLSELRHPNIVSILAKSSLGSKFCMVLEFANGGSVQSILTSKAKRRVFSPSTRLYVAQSLVAALEYLHSKNIFHRDVKPENMCVYDGWEDNPKMVLIDFGIAARVTDTEASCTMTSNPGTEYFMAPEYAVRSRCHFTEKSEVFSVGAVMTCLLLGDCSFSLFSNNKADFPIDTLLGNVGYTVHEWHGGTKHDFATLINRCTSRNADRRPTVKQLLHEVMGIRSRQAELEYRNLSPQSTKRVQAHVSSSRKSQLPEVVSSSHNNCLRCGIGRRQGIMCLSRHFICCESTCLEDLARAHKGQETFPCPGKGCGNTFLLRDFYGKVGASVYSELVFAMDQNAERNLLTQSMANILATLKEEFGCIRTDVQEGLSSVTQEVRAGNAVISTQLNSQLAAIRSNHADLQGLCEEARKYSIEKLQQFAEKQERREQNLEAELKAIQKNQMNSVGDPDSMELKLNDILIKLERLSLQDAKGVSLLASGRLQCPRLCLLWPCRGPRRLNMRKLLYKEYRLYFLCAHDHSLVETSITIKQTKAWVKKIAPVIKFAILSIRMLVNVYGFPIPSLPGFIPGSPGMEQFGEVVQHMEALLEQTESGALSGLKEWLDECQYEDDLSGYILERESEVSPEAYGALAIEAYKPLNRGWMAEMEIVNKGDMYAWVKKENVEQWKASI